jgi:heme/copper-type cytochrome/quinol oxidase subunit 3
MSAAHGEQVRVLEEHGIETTGRSPEWWGMMFFITSEALIFANLIAAYLYLEIRGNLGVRWATPWVLPNGDHLDYVYPAFNTLILIISSGWMHLSGMASRKGNMKAAARWLILTIVFGVIFLGGQVYEYIGLYHGGFNLQYKAFGSAFFLLTGFHGLHVTIGATFLLILLIRTMRGDFTAKKRFALEAGEMYWHFVDIVWVVVFSTVYLLPLLMVK